jgi:fructose-bisphosphate aldolase class II
VLTSAQIISNALSAGVAVPAFNIPHLPMIEPIVRAVVEQDAFAFISVARPDWMKGAAGSPATVQAEYDKWHDPHHVRLHLDHVPVIDEDDREVNYLAIISQALELGYDSVMVDGSRLPLAENIAATRRAVELAHAAGVACEAELGRVWGHEAGPLPPYEELFESGQGFTDVEEARRFIRETECDWLSVAIGNVHGPLSEALKDKEKVHARLNLEHLVRLQQATQKPLVLHGGSGIPKEYVLQAIKRGIAKINVATEVRQTYERALAKAGKVAEAQNAVYVHICRLIGDEYGLAGTRERILAAPGQGETAR